MICYVKDGRTFLTKAMSPAQYDLVIRSIDDETSSITMPDKQKDIKKGDFVFLEDFAGVIDEIDVDDGVVELTCRDLTSVFERPLFATDDSSIDGIESFIKRQIDLHYTNVTDEMYRMPFLEVIAKTKTSALLTPDVEKNVWNIREYMRKAMKTHDIFVDFQPRRDKLEVLIECREKRHHQIDLSVTDCEVLEEVLDIEQTGKITALVEDTGNISDWYLLKDGTTTQTYTKDNRVEGAWEVISVREEAKIEEEIKKIFEKNSYSHLLEFAATENFSFYDTVKIRTKSGRVFDSYISEVRKSSEDIRTVYKTGELRILIDEKLNRQFHGR